MTRGTIVWLIASGLLVTACSEPAEGGPDAAAVEDGGRVEDGARPEDAAPGADASSGGACGTRDGASCPDDQVCVFPIGSCGADDRGGTCEDRYGVCPGVVEPVCGCDGVTYTNDCIARMAGVSVRSEGECGRVDCDRRDVVCRAVEPACPEGEAARVVDGCWGECVPVESCECDEADACPDRDHYTCHLSSGRCGPYL